MDPRDLQLTVRPLDISSDADVLQYSALDEACDRERYGATEPATLANRREGLASTPYWTTRHWLAEAETLDGGRSVVGTATLMLPQQDNLDSADVNVAVHPTYRGLGVGTALVEEALRPAIAESGRGLVTAYGEIPAEGDPDDPSLPANALARRLGLGRRNIGVARTLALPVSSTLLDRLAEEARQKQGDYRILIWQDTVPEEHLAAYGTLLRQLELDDPDEDVEHEAPDFPPERIRHNEQRRARTGRHALIAVALAPDGTLAANSEIEYRAGDDVRLGFQENTLVMPGHRGHRLGLAVKVANHRALAAAAPHLTTLVTWNSHVNPWMISINEQLGYEVAYREVAYQGRPSL